MRRRWMLIITMLAVAGCKPERKEVVSSISLCEGRICLVSTITQDSDGDGVSDIDEKAAGTDPNDPASRPPVLGLLELVGKGRLPSFNGGFSEIVALPDAAPDGTRIDRGDPLTQGPDMPKRDGLAAAGISVEALAKAGISIGGAFNLGIAKPVSVNNQPAVASPPPMRVGGIDVALISQGEIFLKKYEENPNSDPRPEPTDGGTPGPTDGGTPEPPSGGGGADGGTKTQPGWFCRNTGLFCGLTDGDPAGNSVGVIEISAADLARVKAKLGSTTQPGPETPSPIVGAKPIVVRDPSEPIALYDPDSRDGQTLILRTPQTGPNPTWNSNFGPRVIDEIINGKPIPGRPL